MSSEGHSGDVRWSSFAATIFLVLGAFNMIFGIAMIANSEWVVFAPNSAWILDISQWGWVTLIVGAIQVLVGWGVMTEANWARITGIIIAVVSAIDALLVVPIYPVWGLAAFALTVLVIYALSAHASRGASG